MDLSQLSPEQSNRFQNYRAAGLHRGDAFDAAMAGLSPSEHNDLIGTARKYKPRYDSSTGTYSSTLSNFGPMGGYYARQQAESQPAASPSALPVPKTPTADQAATVPKTTPAAAAPAPAQPTDPRFNVIEKGGAGFKNVSAEFVRSMNPTAARPKTDADILAQQGFDSRMGFDKQQNATRIVNRPGEYGLPTPTIETIPGARSPSQIANAADTVNPANPMHRLEERRGFAPASGNLLEERRGFAPNPNPVPSEAAISRPATGYGSSAAGVSRASAAQFETPTKAQPAAKTPTTPTANIEDELNKRKMSFAGY